MYVSGSQAFLVSMSQIMARVRVRSGLTRYRSLSTLLTSTGGSSNRVLDGALQASLYSRSAESNVMLDAMFIEFSTQYLSLLQPARNSAWSTFQEWQATSGSASFPMSGLVHRLPKC